MTEDEDIDILEDLSPENFNKLIESRTSDLLGSANAEDSQTFLNNLNTNRYFDYQKTKAFEENEFESDYHLSGSQIPIGMEEVIASVNTGMPTINYELKGGKNKSKSKPVLKRSSPPKVSKKIGRPRKNPIVKSRSFNLIKNSSSTETNPAPVLGEIVKLQKERSDEESDVDIDESNTDCVDIRLIKELPSINEIIKGKPNRLTQNSNDEAFIVNGINLSEYGSEVIEELFSEDVPESEKEVFEKSIDDIERILHKEYFTVNRNSNKSPEKYLMIRNSIIQNWKRKKPDYLNKTECKNSLGVNNVDILSISKIHKYLEQIGAINFGCDKVKYERPLYKILNGQSRSPQKLSLPRRKIKNKFPNTGEGGCTLTHGEDGKIIDTLVVEKEAPQPSKIKHQTKSSKTYLIHCRSFIETPQKYKVKLDLSALLHMDFHAHTSKSEVMGLLGGYWSADAKTLTIKHYEPCKNQASSSIHCDMCPISQARASAVIHGMGLSILGWFHSHPTFAPEPSQQDLDTQQIVQKWIGKDNPCVGIILSPFSRRETSSSWRCLTVEKFGNEDVYLPYKFDVDIVYENFDVDSFLQQMGNIYRFVSDAGVTESRCVLNDQYFDDLSITYMDKFMTSAKATLQKSPNFIKTLCDEISEGILENCKNRV